MTGAPTDRGQRARLLIKFPDDYTAADLKKDLNDLKCEVEIEGVFLQFLGFDVPDSFKFKWEMDSNKQTNRGVDKK